MLKVLMEKNEEIRVLREIVRREEGRRLFKLCVAHGARPGTVFEWLSAKLEDKSDILCKPSEKY